MIYLVKMSRLCSDNVNPNYHTITMAPTCILYLT